MEIEEPSVAPPGLAPAEPGGPPPSGGAELYGEVKDGPVGGTAGGEFFSDMLGLTLCGKSVTQRSAKRIIYGGVILIAVVVVTLFATLSGGDADAPAPGGPSAAVGDARCAAEMDSCSADAECQAIMQADSGDGTACLANAACSAYLSCRGTVASPAAPAPPAVEQHAGVWASVYYVLQTDNQPQTQGVYRISHGSECQLFHRRKTAAEGGGRESARCGLTENGMIFAWYQSFSSQDNPLCDGTYMGAPVRSGCSRTPVLAGGAFVECCAALDAPNDEQCPAGEMTAWADHQAGGCPPPPPPRPVPGPQPLRGPRRPSSPPTGPRLGRRPEHRRASARASGRASL